MSNLGSMIGVYSALTAGYIGMKYKSLTKPKNKTFSQTYTMIYLLAVIIFVSGAIVLNIIS